MPSRRLGRSIGINNIPAKTCSYSCGYCQVGRTTRLLMEPVPFHDPEAILRDAEARLEEARRRSERVDFLTFVSDGEPTLDCNLGRSTTLLKDLGVPVAVITNGSLLWREDVRDSLRMADWVSVKVDAVDEAVWRRINRPHPGLELGRIQEGVMAFANGFSGWLATETMLAGGMNDAIGHVQAVALFIADIAPRRAYIGVPVRPPAEKRFRVPSPFSVNRACQVFSERIPEVEVLQGYEGDEFTSTGDAAADLLAITAVHPMRADAVRSMLAGIGAGWDLVEELTASGRLTRTRYRGQVFFLAKGGQG